MLNITTETKGLDDVLSEIALLASPDWVTNTLKANKQAFSDLEREHYELVGRTTQYANPDSKRARENAGHWGVDTGALYQDLTNNILIDGDSISIGSDLVYGGYLESLLAYKQSIGQAQETSLLPSDDEFYALLEPFLLDGAEAIWNKG